MTLVSFQHRLLQCAMATVFMFCVLVLFASVRSLALVNAYGASALAASAFTVFAMPGTRSSQPRHIFGSYVIGLFVGVVFHEVLLVIMLQHGLNQFEYLPDIMGAISIGVTMFIMVSLNVQHPPAVGLSLGLVLHAWDVRTSYIVLVAVVILCAVQFLLRKGLKDLFLY